MQQNLVNMHFEIFSVWRFFCIEFDSACNLRESSPPGGLTLGSNNDFCFDRSSDWLELSANQHTFEILSLVASCFRGALPPDPFLAVCLALAIFQKKFNFSKAILRNTFFNSQKIGMSKIVMKSI